MSRTLQILAGVALAATLATGLWRARTSAPDDRTGPSADIGPTPATTTGTTASIDAIAGPHSDPAATGSLRGTEVDGEVRFGADGKPVADAGLRRLFDYHLALMGETDLTSIRALLRRRLSAHHDAGRVEMLIAWFDRYVAYQSALSRSPSTRDADPARRLAETMRLRREILGEAMATGFFAEEEALARLGLRRREIAADPTMSDARKREALAALDRDAGYDARIAAELPEFAARQAEAIERRGATPAQRDAERRALWGDDAARRLAALDAEQADWNARVRRYAEARGRIDQDPRLDAAGRSQAAADLRSRLFTPQEQRRITSLEAIGRLDAALSQ
ncbi:MAG: lipase secretion chaperone [Pseudomonadota bacterium]